MPDANNQPQDGGQNDLNDQPGSEPQAPAQNQPNTHSAPASIIRQKRPVTIR